MRKVFITGINGFAGSHLAEYCLEKDCEVSGIDRNEIKGDNLKKIKNKISVYQQDLSNFDFIHEILNQKRPDWIFHLAGNSSVGASWENPAETIKNNLICQSNLFKAIQSISDYHPRIHIACSSEEYGNSKNSPITENEPLKPTSPYGLSKVVQDSLAEQYSNYFGLDIVRSRAFSHIGPRQRDSFVCSSFAKQLAQIEKGIKAPIIQVGNLSPKRDFTDVRDMVKAYWLLLEKGTKGEVYNLCSGEKGTYSIQEVLDKLIKISNLEVDVIQDNELMRPSDLPISMGDNTKFNKKTGWDPKIPISNTLSDLFIYWKNHV